MKILLVSATQEELRNIEFLNTLQNTFPELNILFTGIGMVKATYALTTAIHNEKPDFVLHTGICGCFNENIPIGTVLHIISEEFADLGFNDNGNFLPLSNNKVIKNKTDWGKKLRIPSVKGITVNTVNGEKNTIKRVTEQFKPDTESMEGAAIAYVCKKNEIPYAEIRAVSNYVEPRNIKNWDIPLAVKNLTAILPEVIHKINSVYEA